VRSLDNRRETSPMKFSIRDLLLVTVIVALALGWWLDSHLKGKRETQWRQEKAELEWRVDALTKAMDFMHREVKFTEDGLDLFDPIKVLTVPFSRPNPRPRKVIPRRGMPAGDY
jgi:hypothetical protein